MANHKFTAIKSFFLRGEVVSPGDVITLTDSEITNCHTKIMPFKKQEVKEVKTQPTRKVSTRKAQAEE